MSFSLPATFEPWMLEGACAETDPELFFPAAGGANAHRTGLAIGVCRPCPVKTKCLAYALTNFEHGIWGGTTEQERARMRSAS